MGDDDKEEPFNQVEDMAKQIQLENTQPSVDDEQTDDTWEIRITLKLRNQLVGPWKTSVILKLMGQPMRYEHSK